MYYTNAEGLLNTYPPLAVIVFVINVKWFTAESVRDYAKWFTEV